MGTSPTPYEALELAVSAAGSQSKFARMMGVSQTAVWKWLQSSKRLPAEFVLAAERETGVSRHLLRPDIYPADLQPFVPHDDDLAADQAERPCDRGDISQGDKQ